MPHDSRIQFSGDPHTWCFLQNSRMTDVCVYICAGIVFIYFSVSANSTLIYGAITTILFVIVAACNNFKAICWMQMTLCAMHHAIYIAEYTYILIKHRKMSFLYFNMRRHIHFADVCEQKRLCWLTIFRWTKRFPIYVSHIYVYAFWLRHAVFLLLCLGRMQCVRSRCVRKSHASELYSFLRIFTSIQMTSSIHRLACRATINKRINKELQSPTHTCREQPVAFCTAIYAMYKKCT